jgi:hypothetical protein
VSGYGFDYFTTPKACGHCGGYHNGACPRIKSVEYHPNGTVRRIEYHDTRGSAALPTPSPGVPAATGQEQEAGASDE